MWEELGKEEDMRTIVPAGSSIFEQSGFGMVVRRTYSKVKVGPPGLEPGTNGLKDRYSNRGVQRPSFLYPQPRVEADNHLPNSRHQFGVY